MNSLKKLIKSVVLLFIALTLTLALAGFGVTSTAFAAASTFTDEFSIPITLFVFVPCAANGLGEIVELNGPLHILFHTTIDSKGGFHGKSHFQPQGISGTGLTTGDRYAATGETQDTFNAHAGVEYTFVNNFKIIGQGPGNNFLVHETYHYTFNANGELTVELDNFSVECR